MGEQEAMAAILSAAASVQRSEVQGMLCSLAMVEETNDVKRAQLRRVRPAMLAKLQVVADALEELERYPTKKNVELVQKEFAIYKDMREVLGTCPELNDDDVNRILALTSR